MADNYQLPTPGTGPLAAADDVGGFLHQRVKVEWGADGTANETQDTTAGALPMKFRTAYTVEDLTTTPLANTASYTTQVFNSLDNGFGLTFIFVADQSADLDLLESHDNVTYYVAATAVYPGASYVFNEMHVAHAKYFKIRVTNDSGSAMTAMVMQTIQRHDGVPWKIKLDENGNIVRGGLTNNDQAPATLNAIEALTAIAQAAAPSYTEGRLVLPRVTLAGDTAVTLDGEVVPVTGTFWQATQPVSGTFWQATQPVSGTVTASNAAGDVAHDGVDTGNPVGIGGIARTAFASVSAALDRVKAIFDLQGRQIVRINAMRALRIRNTITLTSTSETTLLAAAASTFHDLTKVLVINTSATPVRVDFRDTTAGTVMMSLYAPAGQTVGFTDSSDPIEQTTVNTNWTAQLSAAVTDVRIFAQAVKNI